MKVHAELTDITPARFELTATKTCPPEAAAVFNDRANRVAESLQPGIALHRGDSIVPPIKRQTTASAGTEV